MSYRTDGRDKEEFRRDIADGIEQEHKIIERWLDVLESQTGRRPLCRWTGCGDPDQFLVDEEVSTEADFDVEGHGKIEVKFSRPSFFLFHLKVSQLESYVKQNAKILMVKGWDTEQPQFALISPALMTRGLKIWPRIKFRGFGGKLAVRIHASQFVWRDF